MAFRKFNKSEKTEVLPESQANKIAESLKRIGKTSMSDLTEEERLNLNKKLDK